MKTSQVAVLLLLFFGNIPKLFAQNKIGIHLGKIILSNKRILEGRIQPAYNDPPKSEKEEVFLFFPFREGSKTQVNYTYRLYFKFSEVNKIINLRGETVWTYNYYVNRKKLLEEQRIKKLRLSSSSPFTKKKSPISPLTLLPKIPYKKKRTPLKPIAKSTAPKQRKPRSTKTEPVKKIKHPTPQPSPRRKKLALRPTQPGSLGLFLPARKTTTPSRSTSRAKPQPAASSSPQPNPAKAKTTKTPTSTPKPTPKPKTSSTSSIARHQPHPHSTKAKRAKTSKNKTIASTTSQPNSTPRKTALKPTNHSEAGKKIKHPTPQPSPRRKKLALRPTQPGPLGLFLPARKTTTPSRSTSRAKPQPAASSSPQPNPAKAKTTKTPTSTPKPTPKPKTSSTPSIARHQPQPPSTKAKRAKTSKNKTIASTTPAIKPSIVAKAQPTKQPHPPNFPKTQPKVPHTAKTKPIKPLLPPTKSTTTFPATAAKTLPNLGKSGKSTPPRPKSTKTTTSPATATKARPTTQPKTRSDLKLRKIWKEKYNQEIKKLERKRAQYRTKWMEFRNKSRREEVNHKRLLKTLKKAQKFLLEFAKKRKTIGNTKKFEFRGVLFTPEQAKAQEKLWRLEVEKIKLEEQASRQRLNLYKNAVKNLEQASKELAHSIANLKKEKQKFNPSNKVDWKKEIPQLQKSLTTLPSSNLKLPNIEKERKKWKESYKKINSHIASLQGKKTKYTLEKALTTLAKRTSSPPSRPKLPTATTSTSTAAKTHPSDGTKNVQSPTSRPASAKAHPSAKPKVPSTPLAKRWKSENLGISLQPPLHWSKQVRKDTLYFLRPTPWKGIKAKIKIKPIPTILNTLKEEAYSTHQRLQMLYPAKITQRSPCKIDGKPAYFIRLVRGKKLVLTYLVRHQGKTYFILFFLPDTKEAQKLAQRVVQSIRF